MQCGRRRPTCRALTNGCVTCYSIIYNITRHPAVGSASYFINVRHLLPYSLVKKLAKSIVDILDLCLPFDGPWSWFNYNVNVCMYCFWSKSSQFFNCFCSKSSQVILLTPSRLKSILSHFSSSASQFSTNKVTPRSALKIHELQEQQQ